MTTCIIDTSVLLPYLNVPMRNQEHGEVVAAFHQRTAAKQKFVLPVATIVETGNFIGQLEDAPQRAYLAGRLAALVKQSLTNQTPFLLFPAVGPKELGHLLPSFSDWARYNRSGLGDLTIRHAFDYYCAEAGGSRVYIWSLDGHLKGFDRPAAG